MPAQTAPIPHAPKATPAPLREVLLVDPEEHSSTLLAQYLQTRGWPVVQSVDARQAIRRCGAAREPVSLILHLDDDEPDTFELLAAIIARVVNVRAVICAPPAVAGLLMAAKPKNVERVLVWPLRFSEIAAALEELDVREEAS